MNCPRCHVRLDAGNWRSHKGIKSIRRTVPSGGDTAIREMPKRFHGLNTSLRYRLCPVCKYKFFTLELTELDLLKMIQRGAITPDTVLSPTQIRR